MKFIASAIVTLASVVAFANPPASTTTTSKETTTTTAPAAPAPAAGTVVKKTEVKKETSKAEACAKLTDAKAKADCEKKAVHAM